MKKAALTAGFALAACALSAQIKVYSGGKAAFGSTSTTPNYMIDVISGDANVNTLSNGYRLNGKYVLWQNNVSTCIFAGPEAGNSNTAKHNSGFGYRALYTVSNSTTTPVSAFGYRALYNNTAFFNDAFGDSAMYANTTGASNSAFGAWALTANTTSSNNTCFGGKTLAANTTNGGNCAFGWAALNKNTGGSNLRFGYEALINVTSGSSSSALGYQALANATTGAANTAIGYKAGFSVTTGGFNTFVGNGADMSGSSSYTNCAAYGNSALVDANNKIVIGNAAATTVRFFNLE
jgi:hypothetical protein